MDQRTWILILDFYTRWKIWQCRLDTLDLDRVLIKDGRYGYITNTRVKFIVVVSVTDGIIRDAEMKAVSHTTFCHSKYSFLACSRSSKRSIQLIFLKYVIHSTILIHRNRLVAKHLYVPLTVLVLMQE